MKEKKGKDSKLETNLKKAKSLLLKYDYILFVLIILLVFSPHVWHFNKVEHRGNAYHTTAGVFLIENSFLKNHEFPIWFHHIMGGEPLGNISSLTSNVITTALAFLLKPAVAQNLSVIIHILIMLFGFYAIANKLLKDKTAALIALACFGTACMVVQSFYATFWLFSFAFASWTLLFLHKAIKEDNTLRDSIILGVLLGVEFLGGGVMHFYYSLFLLFFYFIFLFISEFSFRNKKLEFNKKRLKKYIILGVAALVVFIGISSPKLGYMFDWLKYTNRGEGLPLEEVFSLNLNSQNFVQYLLLGTGTLGNLSVIANLLFLAGIFFSFKKKNTLVFFMIFAYTFYLVLAFAPLQNLLIKIPGMESVRMIGRITIMNVFIASIIAGFGGSELAKLLKKKELRQAVPYIAFALLLVFSIVFVRSFFYPTLEERMEYPAVIYNSDYARILANDNDIFRFHINEVQGVDYQFTNAEQYVFGLESVYGITSTMWDYRYFHGFLPVALTDRAKLLGMFNVKYFLSSKKLNETTLELFSEFNVGKSNINPNYKENATTYIYLNKRFMPRAYHSKINALIVGNDYFVEQAAGLFLVHNSFNPEKASLIISNQSIIENISLEELKHYQYVILGPDSVKSSYGYEKLQEYIKAGGKTVPSLNSSLSIDEQFGAFVEETAKVSELYDKIEITEYYDTNPNTMVMKTGGIDGIIVIGDKMSLYAGWKCKSENGNLNIENANLIMSAIKVTPKDSTVRCDFSPSSYRYGVIFNSIILVLLGAYILHYLYFEVYSGHKPSAKAKKPMLKQRKHMDSRKKSIKDRDEKPTKKEIKKEYKEPPTQELEPAEQQTLDNNKRENE
ncbi:MAG: DUF6541 family protein [Candidatus Woesearchaeota archaeon]